MRVNWSRLYLGQELGQGRTSNPLPPMCLAEPVGDVRLSRRFPIDDVASHGAVREDGVWNPVPVGSLLINLAQCAIKASPSPPGNGAIPVASAIHRISKKVGRSFLVNSRNVTLIL